MNKKTAFMIFLILATIGALGSSITYKHQPSKADSYNTKLSTRLDLGVTDGYTKWVNYLEASADGIKRYNIYYSWRDLEPKAGKYSFTSLDQVINETYAAGMKVALEIEITDVSCTDPKISDNKCINNKLPKDLRFSRNKSSFDNKLFVKRINKLVKTIIKRYRNKRLTHLYVGNEVDTYLRTVKEDNKRDLFPGFINLMRSLQINVNKLKRPKPKFGTAFTFYAFPQYYKYAKRMSRVVDVIGLTIYPTDPDWNSRTPVDQRVTEWLDLVSKVTKGPRAITEIGDTALAPYGTETSQKEFAEKIIDYLKTHPKSFQYATWFSMYDNPPLKGYFFEGTGLKTIDDDKRPAYDTWANQ